MGLKSLFFNAGSTLTSQGYTYLAASAAVTIPAGDNLSVFLTQSGGSANTTVSDTSNSQLITVLTVIQ